MYGYCVGGPYDRKPLIHGEPRYNVVIEDNRFSRPTPVPGKLVSADTPNHGTYVWDFEGRRWHWKLPAEASSPKLPAP